MSVPTAELIELTLRSYGARVTPQICAAIQRYVSLLLRWNERISLTTIRDPLEILRLHFGESMFAASAVPIKNGRLADVGTGAGFPGIPLKLLFPSMHLLLLDSNARKAAFLHECIRELGLGDVEVHRGRFENFQPQGKSFDFVAVRALGGYSGLIQWARGMLASEGKLILWLGHQDAIEISKLGEFLWRGPVSVPGSDRRVLLIGTPRQ